jgi:hypothetical protein
VDADAIMQLQREHATYVLQLRRLLVEKLKLKDEYERLTMYARDKRFETDVEKAKWELGRVIVDILHCPMRMNEKALLFFFSLTLQQ